MLSDLRYALRQLARHPGFTAVVVLTVALGIGPNIAIFSLIYGILLRPLPYSEPQTLVRPMWQWQSASGATNGLTATQYAFWKEHNRVFAGIAGYRRVGAGFNLVAKGEPAYVRSQFVSADLFPLLGVPPIRGRGFLEEEDRPGGPPVAIASHALWQQRLGGVPDVIGSTILVNGSRHTVVGVMPPDFRLDGEAMDLWLPMRLEPNPADQGHNTVTIARLRSGVTLDQAQAEMPRLLDALRLAFPGHVGENERGVRLEPYQAALVGDVRSILLLLMGAVGLVLLIATANTAGLLLGRAAAREHEFVVRRALGARARIAARPLIAESVVLSLLGGAASLLLADWSLGALLALAPATVPFLDEVRLDLPVLGATLALSLIVGVAAALPPTMRLPRRDLRTSLQGGDRAVGPVRQRARTVLVGTQLALSTTLLAGALLLVVSLAKLWGAPPGFDPQGVWVVQMSLPPEQYRTQQQATRFAEDVRERLAALPGVVSVATTSSIPMERGLNTWVQALKDGKRVGQVIEYRAVSADYFATLGIPLMRGRPVLADDTQKSRRVVVPNRALAELFWPGRDPVGETVWHQGVPAQVVGVAGDVREFGLDASVPPVLYAPAAQLPDGFGGFVRRAFVTSWLVRSSVSLNASLVQRTVAQVDATQPIVSVRQLEEVIAEWLGTRRFVGALLNAFAALALTLAAVGVYGVVSYTVSRRRRELGLRAALGARRRELVGLVLKQGVRLALVGAVVGLALAALVTRFLRSLLFDIHATNVLVLIGAAVMLTAVALMACYVPAQRASHIDPMEALRHE